MGEHTLKTFPLTFDAIVSGARRFDLRSEEGRRFEVGDKLTFREMGMEAKKKPEDEYTGRTAISEVLYVLRGPDFGLSPGYAILSITTPQKQERADGAEEGVPGDAEASKPGLDPGDTVRP